MAILVHFRNNKFDYVEDSDLDTLIGNKTIIAFKHESGWVKIGEDPIGCTGVKQDDKGPERRAPLKK